MSSAGSVAALTACALTVSGCGATSPDYQSLWTSTPPSATTPEGPVPLAKYLDEHHIGREQVAPESIPGLIVKIPVPKGWSRQTNPKLPTLTEVIGKGETYPRAVLTVLRLTGDVNATEVIEHGLGDAGPATNFHVLDSSGADFHGFPSGMVQGSHDLGGKRLHSWFRMVVATGATPERSCYLVQLTITTLADRAQSDAADVEAIISGFTVAAG